MSQAEWNSLYQRCSTELLICSKNVVMHLENNNKKDQLKILDDVVKKYCILDLQNSVYDRVLETNKQPATFDGDFPDQQINNFNKKIQEAAEIEQKKIRVHPLMKDFQSICKNASENLDSSDIVETSCTQDYIDPITKKTIQKPVKNVKCGHLYDDTSIRQLIQMKSNTRCPVMGCGNRAHITLKDLVVDQVALKNLTQSQREET